MDEIDAVLSLSFSSDEFFAAIRACYNRRAETPELDRLTFCLIGVASPTDLNENPRTTPFNIGRRIELADFTEEDGGALAQGLHDDPSTAQVLLRRVLHWTNGHPYLTQRFCHAIAEDGAVSTTQDVDRICGDLFLSEAGRDQDTNLTFARDRVLRSPEYDGVDLADLLTLYENVVRGKRVPVDDSNPLVSILTLAGTVRVDGAQLRVRNRIYESVFDRAWVRDSMPGSELRRQKLAYRRGVMRTVLAGAAVVAVIVPLALIAAGKSREVRLLASRSRTKEAIRLLESGDGAGLLHLIEARQLVPAGSTQAESLSRLWSGWYGVHRDRLWRMLPSPGGASSLAYSPDGKTLVVGSYDGSVVIWDLQTGESVRSLVGHTASVQDVVFSPDGRLIASGGWDRTARIWDVSTGAPASSPLQHDGIVRDLKFSPDGAVLATGGDTGLRIWDVATGRLLANSRSPLNVAEVAFEPAGQSLVVTTVEVAAMYVWEWKDETLEEIPTPLQGLGLSVAYSPDGLTFATGVIEGSVQFWDAPSHSPLGEAIEIGGSVQGLAFSPDGSTLAICSGDRATRFWDLEGRHFVGQPIRHTGFPDDVAFSPNGDLLAVAADEDMVRVWRVGTDSRLVESVDTGGQLQGAVGNPSGTHVALTGVGVRVLNQGSWDEAYPPIINNETVWALAYSPNGVYMATGTDDGSVRLWDAATGQPVGHEVRHAGLVRAARFSRDGSRFATGARDGTVQVWATATQEPVGPGLRSDDAIYGIAFLRGGQYLAAGTGKGLRIWDVESAAEQPYVEVHQRYVGAVAVSSSGTLMATGGVSSAVMRETENGNVVGPALRHDGFVYDVEFSPDETLIATGSYDGTVGIWDVESGHPFGPRLFHGPSAKVRSVQFLPAERSLMSASGDGRIRIWRLPETHRDVEEMERRTWACLGQRLVDPDTTGFLPVGEWRDLRAAFAADTHERGGVKYSV